MPKYLIRSDGAIYPYSTALARDSRFKVVDELPESHVRSIERARGRTDNQLEAVRAMRRAQDARIAERQAASEAVRQRVNAGPKVDAEAAGESQRQASEFIGTAEAIQVANDAPAASPDAPVNDGEFVIATATEDQLRQHAKETFGVTLHHKAGIDKLRAKVAELHGIKPE